jgi:hypothetical protein
MIEFMIFYHNQQKTFKFSFRVNHGILFRDIFPRLKFLHILDFHFIYVFHLFDPQQLESYA